MTRVVVIDDSASTQAILAEVLANRGWEYVGCTDAAEGVSLVKATMPDVIVLDLWFDEPDTGWRILEALAGDPATAAIPVIVCSDRRDSLHESQARLEEQASAVLVKPFSIDDVDNCLDFALGPVTVESL